MIGVVKKLMREKNFGFIRTKEGEEYFFHATCLKNVKFNELTEGQEVTFEDAEGSKGLRAEDIYV